MSDKEYVHEIIEFLAKKRDDGTVSAQYKDGISDAINTLTLAFALDDDDPPIQVPDDDEPPIAPPSKEKLITDTPPSYIQSQATQATASLGTATDLSSVIETLRQLVVDASTPAMGTEQSASQPSFMSEYARMISMAQGTTEFTAYFEKMRDIMQTYMTNPNMVKIYSDPDVVQLSERLGGDMEKTYQQLLQHPKYGPILSRYQDQMTQSMQDTVQTFMDTPKFSEIVQNVNVQNLYPDDHVEGGSLKK